MKVSELIERLQRQPQNQDVEIFVGDAAAEHYPVQGVGTRDPANGEPVKTVVLGFVAQ